MSAAPAKVTVIQTTGKLSVAEIEAMILEQKKNGQWNNGLQSGQRELFKALADIDTADIPPLLAFMDKNLPKQMRWGMRYQLLQRWAEEDVTAAMAYANSLTDRQEREAAVGIVAGAWAEKDPRAATDWLKQLPRGQLRDQVLNSVVNAMAGTDPQAALDLSQALGSSYSRRFGMGSSWQIFQQWAGKDPITAAAKAAELASGQQRSQAYQAIASTWAATDPQSAMDWANSLANGNDKRNALNSILSTWAQSDVTSAMAYAKQLPEGPAKNQALSSISQQWAQQDPQAAMDFANSLPRGKSKSDLLGSIVNGWMTRIRTPRQNLCRTCRRARIATKFCKTSSARSPGRIRKRRSSSPRCCHPAINR